MPDQINQVKLDANESAFFTRQLEYVKKRTYDTKYKNLKASMLIPVSTEAESGADTIVYQSYSKVGFAKIISDYAKDFPRVDVYGTEASAKIRSVGDSYGYSIKEIRRSQKANKELDSRRAAAARRAMDEKLDSIAWNGDDEYGINGLIDYPGITEYTVVAGASTTKVWADKTPDEIVFDISDIINTGVVVPTKGREVPDTLILPLSRYNLIATTRMTDGDSKTILQFVMETNPYLNKIEWVNELETAGASSTARMMTYVRDPEHLTLEVPQPFEQFPAQWSGMEAEIPCHMETAGVIVYYPLSIAYGDGI